MTINVTVNGAKRSQLLWVRGTEFAAKEWQSRLLRVRSDASEANSQSMVYSSDEQVRRCYRPYLSLWRSPSCEAMAKSLSLGAASCLSRPQSQALEMKIAIGQESTSLAFMDTVPKSGTDRTILVSSVEVQYWRSEVCHDIETTFGRVSISLGVRTRGYETLH